MKPMSSMAYFRLHDGTGWVRVQRADRCHFRNLWLALSVVKYCVEVVGRRRNSDKNSKNNFSDVAEVSKQR